MEEAFGSKFDVYSLMTSFLTVVEEGVLRIGGRKERRGCRNESELVL